MKYLVRPRIKKTMKIKITIEENGELVCRGEANSVLEAEGELERLARFIQREKERMPLLDEEVDAVVGVGDEKQRE